MSKQFCAALDKFPNRFRMKIANNGVTTEDVGQQETKLNFEMPAQVPTPESKSASVPTATATLASVNGAPSHSLMPVCNSLKPQMELTSSTASRPAELLVKDKKEESLGTLPLAMADPPVLRQALSLSTKDYLEQRWLEQKRLEELKRQRALLNMEKQDSSILSDAASKQEKEESILPHEMLVHVGSKIDPQEANFNKTKKEPKPEKKLEIHISENKDKSHKTKEVPDALEIDLKPEHTFGNHSLAEYALLPKLPSIAPNQASLEQNHRQGNTLGSRLALPVPPFATTDGSRDRADKHQRANDGMSRDALAMGDISSHRDPVNSVNARYAGEKKIIKLPHYRSVNSYLVPSDKHHRKRERARHYQLCEEKKRLQEEQLPATYNATCHVNAPLKLKIQIPLASSSGVSPSKCPPDPRELKMTVKTPVVGQTQPEMESTNGFKLKISLKGPSGKVESVATGDQHSSRRDDTLSQTAARINGGSNASHGVKLILSKDRISGEYQHRVSSHHEEQRLHHHHRRRRHSKQHGTEHNGLTQKRSASHPLLEFQKLKILRLGSEVNCGSNGLSNHRNSVKYSGLYSQHPGHSTSVHESAFSVAGLVQPSLPPPLPREPSPPPSAPPPPLLPQC